ncbi:hypothetical protein ANCCEY_07249 [Ancylostoma ceylanicum]|uniref:Oxoglutarate/iron-dependent oxygenase C-terminal degradation domain-containing protein n=1 Tax=Ancylostoma ceylanicum TaxID=53326 RepID=A0A0D6LR20_9BILA|nr:hypothetical protein ANCCEY_07249 [Ancylostoma ceylanicum]
MAKARVKKSAASRGAGTTKRPRLEPSSFVINPIYKDTKFAENVRSDLNEKLPFPHWQLSNFLEVDPSVIERVEKELIEYPAWHRKENDLYSLLQTPDLQTLDAAKYPAITGFRQFLYNEMREWLANVSGIELLPQVDSTGSCYATTDCLLPHSDQLFSVRSWHSVAEVIGEENCPRLSINGWFHTNRPIQPHIRPPLVRPKITPQGEVDLSSFFSAQVLNENSEKSMGEVFKSSSELLIKDSFQKAFHDEILLAMGSGNWIERGPVNKRWMAEYNIDDVSDGCVAKFVQALRSETMMTFVKKVTGSEYEEILIEPHTTLRIYRLTHGCYTVLGDEDAEQYMKDGLSADFWVRDFQLCFFVRSNLHEAFLQFYFGKSNWNEDAGGEVVYIKKDVEEPILRCPPTVGAMAIVRRDKDVFPFLKYVNHYAKPDPIYVIALSVYGLISSKDNDVQESTNAESSGEKAQMQSLA